MYSVLQSKCDLILRPFHVHLRKICIFLFGGLFSVCLLGQLMYSAAEVLYYFIEVMSDYPLAILYWVINITVVSSSITVAHPILPTILSVFVSYI